MISTGPPHPGGKSSNTAELRRVFRKRVHQLLKLGYDRLTPAEFCGEQEETITGSLVEAIEAVLDCRSDDWMMCFSVHEDPRVHDKQRKGKSRRRVDLRFDSSQSRPRTRFSFEAKRLGQAHGISKYLGDEGLGCILTGAYARDDDEAGMLGYVQSGSLQQWADKIMSKLKADASGYNISEQGQISGVKIVDGLDHTYRSDHDRPSVGRRVSIFHTLLQFN